ncbi:hypothetical protein ACIRON_30500 [Nocardioides sp. NPDC101246]|uniref:hypothetical protein n=1 Tax=Nocardioides sp. NPDC101246 TaxID=3364336 RepID=UPI00382015F1
MSLETAERMGQSASSAGATTPSEKMRHVEPDHLKVSVVESKMGVMSDYTVDVSINHETNQVYAVTVSTRDGQYVGRWEEPYEGVTARDLRDKDEVRRIVNEIRALRIRCHS